MWTHLLVALCKILALLTATSESQTRGELLPAGFSVTFGNRKFKIFKAKEYFFRDRSAPNGVWSTLEHPQGRPGTGVPSPGVSVFIFVFPDEKPCFS